MLQQGAWAWAWAWALGWHTRSVVRQCCACACRIDGSTTSGRQANPCTIMGADHIGMPTQRHGCATEWPRERSDLQRSQFVTTAPRSAALRFTSLRSSKRTRIVRQRDPCLRRCGSLAQQSRQGVGDVRVYVGRVPNINPRPPGLAMTCFSTKKLVILHCNTM